ncbi:unnamed protein product [Linum trigynum]
MEAFVYWYLAGTIVVIQKKDIATFQQGSQENFWQAWERFGVLIRRTLNHGYSDDRLNEIFHNGLQENFREMIERRYPIEFRYVDLEQAKELCNHIEQVEALLDRELAIQSQIREFGKELKKLT